MTSVHDFQATRADGTAVPLADYAGRVLLIVNVASKCGLTPQYEGLESLYREFRDEGSAATGRCWRGTSRRYRPRRSGRASSTPFADRTRLDG